VTAGPPTDPHGATAAELKARIGAERRGTPFLVYRDGDGKQAIVELSGGQITVGRRADNDIVLSWDQEVSRIHAQLEQVGGDWCVIDDGLSRNGSWLNAERVRGRHRLKNGDRLCFGATVVDYRAPAEGESKSTISVPGRMGEIEVTEAQRKVLVSLCRPLVESAFATPATNKTIADEVFLSVDAVKAHLRVLFERFGMEALPQNQKRASLAAAAFLNDVVRPHDL